MDRRSQASCLRRARVTCALLVACALSLWSVWAVPGVRAQGAEAADMEDAAGAGGALGAALPSLPVLAYARAALATLRGVAAVAATPPEPLTAAALLSPARKLRVGLSIGTTSAGRVLAAASLNPTGKRLAVLATHVSRDRYHGAASLVDLLQDAAAEVAHTHKGARVIVGDLSSKHGGKVSGHRSHQAGRDADIAFFYADAKGKPVEATAMWRVKPSGLTSDGLTFDVARNWSLVRALLTHPTSQTQYIFVAKHLRAALLAEAARRGEAPDLIARAQEILRQPSDSAPHDDHFHIRVLCDRDERLEGCLNRGRLWPWADLHEGPVLRRAQALIDALPTLPPADAERALGLLLDLEADIAAPWLAATLPALPPATRALAYKTLSDLPRRALYPSTLSAVTLSAALLTQALPRFTDPSDRQALPGLLLAAAFTSPRVARASTRALLQAALSQGDTPLALAALTVTASPPAPLSALTFAPVWLDLLDHPDAPIRAAAADRLRDATHHLPPPLLASADLAAHWRGWWATHHARSPQDMLLLGLRDHGLSPPASLASPDAIPSLIAAQTATPPATALAAHATLTTLTKHARIPATLPPAERHRLWTAWLAKQKKAPKKPTPKKRAP